MTTLTVDAVIKKYVSLRDQKAVLRAATDAALAVIDDKMLKVEAWIKEQADAQGVTSFKTKHGTAFLTTVDFASVADWDAVLNFIKTNDAFDMLERRVNKKAVRAWIDNTSEVPAGINYGTRMDVGVRRPANKGELESD